MERFKLTTIIILKYFKKLFIPHLLQIFMQLGCGKLIVKDNAVFHTFTTSSPHSGLNLDPVQQMKSLTHFFHLLWYYQFLRAARAEHIWILKLQQLLIFITP